MCAIGSRLAAINTAGDPATSPSLQLLDLADPGPAWQDAPAGALAPIPDPSVSCLGDQIMVTAPYTAHDTTGRQYDPATSTWTEIPGPPPILVSTPDGTITGPSPFAPTAEQRIWTGAELLMLNTAPKPGVDAGLAPGLGYDPTTKTWRNIPPLPAPITRPQWTGAAIVGYAQQRDHAVVVHYVPK